MIALTRDTFPRRLQSGASAVIVTCLLLTGLAAARSIVDRRYVEYGEGTVLAAAERLQTEDHTPEWLTAVPVTIVPYGPGYYWTVSAVSSLIRHRQTLVIGRALSLVTLWIIALGVAVVIYRWYRRLDVAAFSALVVLQAPVLQTWSALYRVDMLAGGLALASYALISQSFLRIVAAAASVVLATVVKQTFALTVLPLLIWLILQGNRKNAVRFTIAALALGVIAWGGLVLSSLDYFSRVGLLPVSGNFSFRQAGTTVTSVLNSPFTAGALASAWILALMNWRAAVSSVSWVGFVFSFVLACILAGKEGSSTNYFIETSVLGCVVVGRALTLTSQRFNLTAISLSLAVVSLTITSPDIYAVRSVSLGRPPEYTKIAAVLQEHRHGYPLADGTWIEALALAGRAPAVNDPYAFRLMADRDEKAIEPLLSAVASGSVPLVVLDRPIEEHWRAVGTSMQMWPAGILEVMDGCYRREFQSDRFSLYVFAPDRPSCAALRRSAVSPHPSATERQLDPGL